MFVVECDCYINALSFQQTYVELSLHFLVIIVQASLKTEREKKMEIYFPMKKYAIKV